MYLFLTFKIMSELSANATKVMELVEGLTIVETCRSRFLLWKKKFGVSAAAPVAVVAGGAAAGGDDEEKSSFTVMLTSAGAQKIAVIKVIREITGLGLGEAKALADNGGELKKDVKRTKQKRSG